MPGDHRTATASASTLPLPSHPQCNAAGALATGNTNHISEKAMSRLGPCKSTQAFATNRISGLAATVLAMTTRILAAFPNAPQFQLCAMVPVAQNGRTKATRLASCRTCNPAILPARGVRGHDKEAGRPASFPPWHSTSFSDHFPPRYQHTPAYKSITYLNNLQPCSPQLPLILHQTPPRLHSHLDTQTKPNTTNNHGQ